ncbi:F0F1 ATP synthase subunit epsilon [Fodinisporobacter ferrooxydans]|uniref:ATP synthase epsilon chain n=1 Tax=Fodinisporobacter ferrooxydans TaxID=2901836 RepID=A0ABY4CQU1_9BACL|nr:F0F1 ATP synthase subunit epsilon [Alicyclobacillaceae bacterium MYW30-H2]
MRTVPLEIVTPDRLVYKDDVNMVIARGGDGDLGVLRGHMPLMTTLKPGIVRIKKNNAEEQFVVTSGFMDVTPERVVILADTAESPQEIDVDRARAAKERAEKRLAGKDDSVDVERAKKALERAELRLKAALQKNKAI